MIPGLGRSPGEGNSYLVQDSGLKNSWATVHGVDWEALERGDICLHTADLHCCRRKLTQYCKAVTYISIKKKLSALKVSKPYLPLKYFCLFC